MSKRCLMAVIKPELAEKIYRGETNLIPITQIPDHGKLAEKRTIFLCVDGRITGSCEFVIGKADRQPLCPNGVKDHYGLYVVWVIQNPVKFDVPLQLKAFHLKRAPEEWRYVKEPKL